MASIYPKKKDIGHILHNYQQNNICTVSSSPISTNVKRDIVTQERPLLHRQSEENISPLESVSMIQVRSISAFQHAIDLLPSFSSFVVLRVLDMSDCHINAHNHLNLRDLGSLLHLRYLGLARTGISELPEEVGKLQFLEVLDLSGNSDIKELPSTVTKLRRLMCLLIESRCKRLPDGLGNLTSMEVLREINGNSLSIVKEIGHMKRLRKLGIRFDYMSLELEEDFVKSLGKLTNIQSVVISLCGQDIHLLDLLGECLVSPRSLREFTTEYHIKFSTLPSWIRRNPPHLTQLSLLEISMEKMRQEDLDILGRLPAMCILYLYIVGQSGLLLIVPDGFPRLTSLRLIFNSSGQVVFHQGAMPKVEIVHLWIDLWATEEEEEAAGNGGDCFDLGMGNLPSLRKVDVTFSGVGITVGEAMQAELKETLEDHPNEPSFDICVKHYGYP